MAESPGTSCRHCARRKDTFGSPAQAACVSTRSCSIRRNPDRIFTAISAAGAFRTDDGGKSWRPINKGPELARISCPMLMRK
jgi:hypothetical protein